MSSTLSDRLQWHPDAGAGSIGTGSHGLNARTASMNLFAGGIGGTGRPCGAKAGVAAAAFVADV
jgi:hypothetical protein